MSVETAIRTEIETWLAKQGHDRCWYYPEIFHRIAALLDIPVPSHPILPPLTEFKRGCERYQVEQFSIVDIHPIQHGESP
jgi:hypothetical protein